MSSIEINPSLKSMNPEERIFGLIEKYNSYGYSPANDATFLALKEIKREIDSIILYYRIYLDRPLEDFLKRYSFYDSDGSHVL